MNYLSHVLAAIAKPETLEQAATILLDWLNQIGVNIYWSDNPKVKEIEAEEGTTYRDYTINKIIDDAHRWHGQDLLLEGLASRICEKLTYSMRPFVEEAISNIYNYGYLPDIKKFSQALIGDPDINLLKQILNYSKELAYGVVTDRYDDSFRDFDHKKSVNDELVKGVFAFMETYGRDFTINYSRKNPDGFLSIIGEYNSYSKSDLFKMMSEGADFKLIESVTRENQNIESHRPDEDDDDDYGDEDYYLMENLAVEYGLENELEGEDYTTLPDLRQSAKQRVLMYTKDTFEMLKTTDFDEVYQRLINHDQSLVQDLAAQKNFLFYYNKILKTNFKSFKDFSHLKQIHDDTARFLMQLRHAKRTLLNEELSKNPDFPPPIIQPIPPIITYINNEYDLELEGTIMDHCVGSFTERCRNGESFIYRYENSYARGTIEIESDGTLGQFYGPRNRPMHEDDEELVNDWINGTLDLSNPNLKIDTPYKGTDSMGNQYKVDDLFDNQEGYEYKPSISDLGYSEDQSDPNQPKNANIKNLLRISSREWFRLTDLFG